MAAKPRLTAEQREFLSLVTRAASCNPFSDEFDELQLRIASCGATVPHAERVKLMVDRWNHELHKLQDAGFTSFKQAEGEDREILRYACLYEAYHRYFSTFDQLIEQQISIGDRPLP